MNSEIFHSPDRFPELLGVKAEWRVIRDEAIRAVDAMIYIKDRRAAPESWAVLPLLPEEEDRLVMRDDLCQECRRRAPRTVELAESIPGIKAYAFSLVKPGRRILPHRHANPYLTASLCLQDGGDSYIEVDGERQVFHEGGIIIFDYRRVHEIVNNGAKDRIVLLLLLDRVCE